MNLTKSIKKEKIKWESELASRAKHNPKLIYSYVRSKMDVEEILKESKSMGPDQIHPMILKECALEFARPLTILFRQSIKQGKIPNSWRFANISSIFKKGHRTLRSNYRPYL